MFLLNSDKNLPETEKILFTIQNVPIKLDATLKGFITKFEFTIQNVPIK